VRQRLVVTAIFIYNFSFYNFALKVFPGASRKSSFLIITEVVNEVTNLFISSGIIAVAYSRFLPTFLFLLRISPNLLPVAH